MKWSIIDVIVKGKTTQIFDIIYSLTRFFGIFLVLIWQNCFSQYSLLGVLLYSSYLLRLTVMLWSKARKLVSVTLGTEGTMDTILFFSLLLFPIFCPSSAALFPYLLRPISHCHVVIKGQVFGVCYPGYPVTQGTMDTIVFFSLVQEYSTHHVFKHYWHTPVTILNNFQYIK